MDQQRPDPADDLPADLPTAVEQIVFDNRFARGLPADAETSNTPRLTEHCIYSRVSPVQVRGPRLLAHSAELIRDLGWSPSIVRNDRFAQAFTGNLALDGMNRHAMRYGGHQFGHWAGQLGDGRAINLGEVRDIDGALQMLQLKGAGPTPYSRTADGLAVLRSSVREFLCSEAMHHLGVPTTRALSLCLTGEEVMRDMFYDGNAAFEPGAIVCRVAPSFLRFGNYEILAAEGEVELLRTLADFTIGTLFPGLGPPGEPATYVAWFEEVCRRTAEMVVHWQRVGFVHGVMNTDNMSILGLTIDYGPYGWLEDYDPKRTPNTTDASHKRYRFGTQDQVAGWNLARLASALVPLISQIEPLQQAIEAFQNAYQPKWQSMVASKLGLREFESDAGDPELIAELLELLAAAETDMTIFFRRLAARPRATAEEVRHGDPLADLLDAYYTPAGLTSEHRARSAAWLARYDERVRKDGTGDLKRQVAMDAVNPKYVLRNYLAQLAIDKIEKDDDTSTIKTLLDTLRRPYGEQPQREGLAAKRPEGARHRPGCSTLSCSS